MGYLREMPDTLYKYRVWSDPFHQNLITDQQIFLASPANLNDPFDASLPFRYDPTELTPTNIFKKLMEVGKREFPHLTDKELHELAYERQRSGVFENGDYWKDFHEESKKKLHDNFGVLSLTTKNDNLLMWAHYSNCHKGFCVGFDSQILFDCLGGSIGPVIYSDTFPHMPLFGNTTQYMIKHLNTKSTHWKYEDEYRLTKGEASNKAYKVAPTAITKIIIGNNMPVDQQVALCEAVETNLPHAKIFIAKISLEYFKLDIYPYTNIKIKTA